VDLAKQGITVYTFDFPGHGASPATYGGTAHGHVVEQLVGTLGEVVNYATSHSPPGTKVVLLGYSLGTIAVGEYALQHPNMANLQATILVAGILNDKPTLTTPRNLLVLSGQFDLPGINDIARSSIAAACATTANSIRGATYQCQTHTTDQRKRVILPGLDHISIVTAASTHNVVIQWLGATVDHRIGKAPVNADVRLHWMLVGFLAALLAIAPLIKLLALVFRLQPPQRRDETAVAREANQATGLPLMLGFGAIVGTLVVALLALRAALPSSFWAGDPFPFTFLRQQVSADVAIFFLFAGALIAAALVGIRRVRAFITLPRWREALPQGLIALGVTLFLMVTLGGLSTFAWENLTLEPQRLWRAAVYAVMIWPFFFGLRSLLRAMGPRLRRPVLADLGASMLVILALVGTIAMNFGRLSYLGILLPIFGIVLLLQSGAAAWARRTIAHPVALVATLEALLLAWTLAATLPLVS
jgi:pimeloyl-ACP methyl ester carboxylesterase